MGILKRLFGKSEVEQDESVLTFIRNDIEIATIDSIGAPNRQNELTSDGPFEPFRGLSEFEQVTLFILDLIQNWPYRTDDRKAVKEAIFGYMMDTKVTSVDFEEHAMAIFSAMQDSLAAKAVEKNFLKLQDSAPFKTQAMRAYVKLLAAAKTAGLSGIDDTFEEIYRPDVPYRYMPEPVRLVEESSGHSAEEATVIKIVGPNSGLKGAPRFKLGVDSEYSFLSMKFGPFGKSWKLNGQSLVPTGGRICDVLNITINDTHNRNYYFDIGDFQGNTSFARDDGD